MYYLNQKWILLFKGKRRTPALRTPPRPFPLKVACLPLRYFALSQVSAQLLRSLFCKQFYRNTATPVHLSMVYGCFWVVVAAKTPHDSKHLKYALAQPFTKKACWPLFSATVLLELCEKQRIKIHSLNVNSLEDVQEKYRGNQVRGSKSLSLLQSHSYLPLPTPFPPPHRPDPNMHDVYQGDSGETQHWGFLLEASHTDPLHSTYTKIPGPRRKAGVPTSTAGPVSSWVVGWQESSQNPCSQLPAKGQPHKQGFLTPASQACCVNSSMDTHLLRRFLPWN